MNGALNIHPDNISSMSSSATHFICNLRIDSKDPVTASIIKTRINEAVMNLGDDTEVRVSYNTTNYETTENQPF